MLELTPETANDFLKYFKEKAKKIGISYQIVKLKDNSILKSCVNNYTPTEIKKVIDYIFERDELVILDRTIDYKQYGIYLLSSYYWSKLYNEAMEVKVSGSKKEKQDYVRITY